MNSYIVRRILLFIPTLLGTTVLVFVLVRVLPGDVADALLTETRDPRAAEQLREQLGLDDPIPLQYVRWLGDALRGDLGTSIWTRNDVVDRLTDTLPVSVELALLAVFFSTLIGVTIGTIAAVYQDRAPDYTLRSISIIGLSVPNFWFGTLLLVMPAVWWGYSPPLKYQHLWEDPLSNLEQMMLPALALGLALSSIIARMTRAVMLDVLREDFIRTARAKGLGGRKVVLRHALPNSLIPVVTLIGAQLGFLLGGTVIMERIFTLPGLGFSTLESVTLRDYPQLQANVLVFAIMLTSVNLVVDLVYGWLDPRIRYG